MQINQPQSAQQAASAAHIQPKICKNPVINDIKPPEIDGPHPKLCDQTAFEPIPGKIKPPVIDLSDFGQSDHLIDETLSTALHAKMPFAREYALRHMEKHLKTMTPAQLDDIKDTIVKRMASPDTSQRERDVLKDMYELTDAVAENRPTPGKIHDSIDHIKPKITPIFKKLDMDENDPFRQIEPPIFVDPPIFKKY